MRNRKDLIMNDNTEQEKEGRLIIMRKTAILTIVIATMLVICLTAFAAEIGTNGVASDGGNTLKFSKSILMKNGNSSQVREPNITYTYTITEISSLSNETVTDAQNHVGTVYKLSAETGGDFDSVLPGKAVSVTFEDTKKVNTSANGVETIKNVEFTFNGSKFPHAGIYRFVVTETCSPAKSTVGITTNTDYSSAMFLDVYVQGQGDDTSIYAYVLFENNAAAINDTTKDARLKSAGWSGGDTGSVNQDIYQTYDLEVKKAITGDATSQGHKFPFNIVLTNDAISSKVDLSLSTSGAEFGSTPSSDTNGSYVTLTSTGTVVNAKLSNNGIITIKGIPANTTATVQETNDTHDFYSLTASVDKSSTTSISDADGSVAPNGGVSTITPAIHIDGTTMTCVLFGNNLTTISPTGYFVRYAPYALMLIGGIVLLVIAKKHKKHTDEE